MTSSYIPEKTKARIRTAFQNRCAYCLSSQRYVYGPFEIEHIIPLFLGGSNNEDNLCLACRLCNSYKGVQTTGVDPVSKQTISLFNPRAQVWQDHFCWSKEGTSVPGKTAIGRATVEAIQLNNELAVQVRRSWVAVGWHPPEELG